MPTLDDNIEVLLSDPTANDVAASIRRLARESGRFEDFVRVFAARAELLHARGDDARAVEAWLEAALIAEEELHQLPRAVELYKKVLVADPVQRQALFSLGTLLHDLGRWEDLIELYRRRLSISQDERERVTLELYVAELIAEKLNDLNGALDALIQAAARAPGNLRLLRRLEDLGEQTGRLEEVAITIGHMILHQEDPQLRAALGTRLAELYLGPLDDPTRALAHLRGALADDGGNPWVLEEIEDVFRERARFEMLARLLEELVEEPQLATHRVRLERELARIYEHELCDLPRALGALVRAFSVLSSDRELLGAISRLGSKVGMTSEQRQRVIDSAASINNPLWNTLVRQKLAKVPSPRIERALESSVTR